MPCPGIMESAAILAIAKKHGLKLMIGCMTETMIGMSAAIYLAAGSDTFDYIDLDGIFLLYHKNRFQDISIQGTCCFIIGNNQQHFNNPKIIFQH